MVVFSRKQSVAKRFRKKEEVKRQIARSPVGQVYCFPKSSFGVIFTEVFLPTVQHRGNLVAWNSSWILHCRQSTRKQSVMKLIAVGSLLSRSAECPKSNAGRVARHCFAVRGLCASRRGVQNARCGGDLRKLVSESRSERRLLISSFLMS